MMAKASETLKGGRTCDDGRCEAASAKQEPKPRLILRPMGLLKGQIWIAPDFNDPLPDDDLTFFE
ncbi:MAG: hypothetical protein WC722_13520 [Rhodospirillales bacterium]|jgi:hypothetical protein